MSCTTDTHAHSQMGQCTIEMPAALRFFSLGTMLYAAACCVAGRSDFPNQINNVCAFPYIFRGALDCRAK